MRTCSCSRRGPSPRPGRSTRRSANGRPAPALAGVPVALKDVLDLDGVPTTCGSRILEGYRPPFTATAVARLRSRGAVVIGKTNMDEFAMGSSTENSAYKKTQNPWDLARVPGGSERRLRGRGGRGRGDRSRSAPTPADRSASRRRCAAWWA